MKIPRDLFQYMRWTQRRVQANAAGFVLAAENPDRAVIIIGHTDAGDARFGIAFDGTSNDGLILRPDNAFVAFTFQEHGTLPMQRFVQTNGSTIHWTIIEGIIDRSPCSKEAYDSQQELADAVSRSIESLRTYQYDEG